jgi:hypothetical protein
MEDGYLLGFFCIYIIKMQTTLNYFGSIENSKYGLFRSLIAFVLILTGVFLTKLTKPSLYQTMLDRKLGVFLVIVAVVSAISVQVPADPYDALMYGASVGLVLSIVAAAAWSPEFKWGSVGFVALGTVKCAVIAWIVYELSKYLNWYPLIE